MDPDGAQLTIDKLHGKAVAKTSKPLVIEVSQVCATLFNAPLTDNFVSSMDRRHLGSPDLEVLLIMSHIKSKKLLSIKNFLPHSNILLPYVIITHDYNISIIHAFDCDILFQNW